MSCCFEEDLHWQKNEEIVVPKTWTKGFDSPLIPSAVTFDSNRYILGINPEAARVLDDVRFLITSIAWVVTPLESGSSKIRSTATWLHQRLQRLSDPEKTNGNSDEADTIWKAIRLAGLIFSWSIMSVSHISQFPQAPVKDELYTAMRSVSLTRWKRTPGIFLWIMLVLCPGSVNDQRGRFIRRKMAVAGLSIGFEDFPLGISFLRAFWLVQRWIASHDGDTSQPPTET